jgi:hypothetical protein
MVTDRYAEMFAEAGVSALLYDHRNLGISGGEPRQEINPWVQSRGYRGAVTFAATIEGHDPERIGVWGDSYSAGQVFLVAACDTRIKVVVAQCPVFGAELPDVDPTREVFAAIRETFEAGDVSGGPGDQIGPIPVVSSDQLGTPSLLQPIRPSAGSSNTAPGTEADGKTTRPGLSLPTPPLSVRSCAPPA